MTKERSLQFLTVLELLDSDTTLIKSENYN